MTQARARSRRLVHRAGRGAPRGRAGRGEGGRPPGEGREASAPRHKGRRLPGQPAEAGAGRGGHQGADREPEGPGGSGPGRLLQGNGTAGPRARQEGTWRAPTYPCHLGPGCSSRPPEMAPGAYPSLTHQRKGARRFRLTPLIFLVPRDGVEPPTGDFQSPALPTELPRLLPLARATPRPPSVHPVRGCRPWGTHPSSLREPARRPQINNEPGRRRQGRIPPPPLARSGFIC